LLLQVVRVLKLCPNLLVLLDPYRRSNESAGRAGRVTRTETIYVYLVSPNLTKASIVGAQ